MFGAGAVVADAAETPLAAEHAVIDGVFVEAGAEPGGAHLEGHRGLRNPGRERYYGLFASLEIRQERVRRENVPCVGPVPRHALRTSEREQPKK
jgi:hypothetical protein